MKKSKSLSIPLDLNFARIVTTALYNTICKATTVCIDGKKHQLTPEHLRDGINFCVANDVYKVRLVVEKA